MKRFLPWVLAGAFFIVGVVTIKDYGMNWDEPARLMRGQAFVQFYLTGSPLSHLPDRTPPNLIHPKEYVTRYDFLAAEGPNTAVLPAVSRPQAEFLAMLSSLERRVSFYQHDVWAAYFMKYDPFEAGHLPLPEILGSLSNRILYQAWGIMSDIESYHVPYVLLSAVGVFVATAFTFDITGSWVAAGISGLSLALFPHFFGSAHMNMKDPEIASLFAGCIWVFWRWVKDNKVRWMIGFWIFFALSLAVKWNTAFLPFIFVPWLVTIRKTPEFRRWFRPKKLILLSGVACVACLAFLLLIWPVSWGQPITALWDVVKFYWTIGVSDTSKLQPDGFILPFGFNSYPFLLLLTQTPEIVLLLCLTALYGMVKKQVAAFLNTRGLMLLWFLVPVVRYSLPHMHAYGDWRQMMEVVPALAVLSGVGGAYLLHISKPLIQKIILSIICILFIVVLADMIRIHPNENTYFNHFVGGIRGAQSKNLIDYYLTGGNVYKQGAAWLNAHAEKNAKVAILNGLTFALSPLWLRPDIAISPYYFSAFDQKGEYIFLLPSTMDKPFFAHKYIRRFLKPIHEITIDGVPILAIYKNDPAYSTPGYDHETAMTEFTKEYVSARAGDYLSIDLGRDVSMTGIELTHVPKSCHRTNNFAALEEVVLFTPASPDKDFNIDDHTYVVMEKKAISEDSVRYLFPGDLTRYIKIFPQSKYSCFIDSTVSRVYILQ